MQAVILDPEVVFVASLMKVDTPALVVSFQSDFSLQVEDGNQSVRASLSGLKVLACPFIPNQQDKAVTTVRSPDFTHTALLCPAFQQEAHFFQDSNH